MRRAAAAHLRRRLRGGVQIRRMSDVLQNALAAIALAAFSATFTAFIAPAYAPGWTNLQCVRFSLSAWVKVCLGFLYLYAVQILDRRDESVHPIYLLVFIAAGGYFLSSDFRRAGFASSFPGIGIAAATSILAALCATYVTLTWATHLR